jgi:hypothetical protein
MSTVVEQVDMKELSKSLGKLLINAERYKEERDKYKNLTGEWEDYSNGQAREIDVLKRELEQEKARSRMDTTPRGLLQQELNALKVQSHQQLMKIEDLEELVAQKAKTNKKLLAALDKKADAVASRTRSKKNSQQIVDDWTKSS